MHLAAVEKFYQLNTPDGVSMKNIPDAWKEKGSLPMEFGDPARKTIVGYDLNFYLELLGETREKTLAEFRKRDSTRLMTGDRSWGWGPAHNDCKWFHVTEHEVNHNGQIKFLKSRILGAESSGGVEHNCRFCKPRAHRWAR